jgi:4'-phosphopantetheinyl transferase
MHGNLQLWLAAPDAAQHFDPAQLTAGERDRYSRLRRPQRRQEFAVSRALRAYVLRDKPQPASESLSHSGGYAALALAPPELRVGVDLEVHRPRDVLATARTAFGDPEARALAAATPAGREQLFYVMWTVKEAFAKAAGLPLLEALRSCAVFVDDGEWQIRAPTSAPGCVAVYQPRADLTLAVMCIGATVPIECSSWPPQQPAAWPLIAASVLAAAGAHAAAGPGSAGAARAAAPA